MLPGMTFLKMNISAYTCADFHAGCKRTSPYWRKLSEATLVKLSDPCGGSKQDEMKHVFWRNDSEFGVSFELALNYMTLGC